MISYRRAQKRRKATNHCTRLGHSLRSANRVQSLIKQRGQLVGARHRLDTRNPLLAVPGWVLLTVRRIKRNARRGIVIEVVSVAQSRADFVSFPRRHTVCHRVRLSLCLFNLFSRRAHSPSPSSSSRSRKNNATQFPQVSTMDRAIDSPRTMARDSRPRVFSNALSECFPFRCAPSPLGK